MMKFLLRVLLVSFLAALAVAAVILSSPDVIPEPNATRLCLVILAVGIAVGVWVALKTIRQESASRGRRRPPVLGGAGKEAREDA